MGLFRPKPYLIIPDLHAPYQHKDSIKFLKEVHKKYGCNSTIIQIGDLFDFNAISHYAKELDAPTAKDEYQKALLFSKELTKAFPKGVLVLGNHDCRVKAQLKEIGMPIELVKSYNDLLGLPKGWVVKPLCHIIKEFDVLCEHGNNSTGSMGALTTAIYKRTSYVQGHAHSAGGCLYSANHRSLIFGLNVGCLVDNTSIGMAYGEYLRKKGTLGCGVVFSGCNAIFVPMEK